MKKPLFTVFILFLFSPLASFASWVECDSSDIVTISGYAMVDTSVKHGKYFLDEDGDDVADYKLNFGPWWYSPDSGSVSRPEDGQFVTIEGALSNSDDDSMQVIKVFTIDGEIWRDPFIPGWNKMGKYKHRKTLCYRNHLGFAFGWLNDSLTFIEESGTALVDSTCKYVHYFLDTDADTIPDFYLNFGPPWYNPDNGLTRPADGDPVKIGGVLFEKKGLSIIFVITLNDEVWVDTTGLGENLGGCWIFRNMKQLRHVCAAHDSLSGFHIGNGWFDKEQNDISVPDELFCRIIGIFPENVPYAAKEKIAAGYEIGVFTHSSKNMLMYRDSIGGQLQFSNQVQFRLHYLEKQLQAQGLDEKKLAVKYWDRSGKTWKKIEQAAFDYETNTVTFDSDIIPGLLILSADGVIAIGTADKYIPGEFKLNQNYPNPFNAATTIEFNLQSDSYVRLFVFNTAGQLVSTLINNQLKAGIHSVRLHADHLPSGIYYYRLETEQGQKALKMLLIK